MVAFQRFRLDTYLSSGVDPKRYFGFLDERGDTAPAEALLRHTIEDAVPLVNRYAAAKGATVRITEMEVAVTFLAEGGALLLSDPSLPIDRIHPVNGIGLDSFREAFDRHRALVATLDDHLGTHLGSLSWRVGRTRVLRRPMTFREAILGTAILFLDEKMQTAELLRRRDGVERLAALPPERQFVMTSLVYNSGVLLSEERIDQILTFSTADYLERVNEENRNRRPSLPLYGAAEATRRLVDGEPIPRQLTSWSAVYHVLQRYGAWTALRRFSDIFDNQGCFTRR